MKIKLPVSLAVMIVVMLSRCLLAQQNPHGQLLVATFPKPYLFLIRDPIVHDELVLTAQQRIAINALNDQLDADLWSMRNKSAQHIDQTMQQAITKAKSRLSSLLAPSQQERLEQIELWTRGMKAFGFDELPEKLSLSASQRDEIRATLTKTNEAVNELGKQFQAGQSRESLEKKAKELRTDEQKTILGLLTRQQQQQWAALLGKRIDVAKLGKVKFKAPELSGRDGWINSTPLTLRQLKGKVVALHFYAFA
jgi:hypothetical protein